MKNLIYKYITKYFSHASSHFFTASERKEVWFFFITFPTPLEQSLLLISNLNPDSLHNASADPVCPFKFEKNNGQIKFSCINILTLKPLDGMLITTALYCKQATAWLSFNARLDLLHLLCEHF